MTMSYSILGRTGLNVSRASLGAWRMVDEFGVSEAQAIDTIRKALDLGVNFIDTAQAYGALFGKTPFPYDPAKIPGYGQSEERIGKALAGYKGDCYVATKYRPLAGRDPGLPLLIDANDMIDKAEASLRRLGRPIDILMLHGIRAEDCTLTMEGLVPVARKLQQQGKVRFLGVSENVPVDPRHEMVKKLIPTGAFDMVLMKYSLLNQLAEDDVFPLAERHNVGVALLSAATPMSAGALVKPEPLAKIKERLGGDASPGHPLDFLLHDGIETLYDACYQFAASHPAVDTVLCGARSPEMMAKAANAIATPIRPDDLARLKKLKSFELDCLAHPTI